MTPSCKRRRNERRPAAGPSDSQRGERSIQVPSVACPSTSPRTTRLFQKRHRTGRRLECDRGQLNHRIGCFAGGSGHCGRNHYHADCDTTTSSVRRCCSSLDDGTSAHSRDFGVATIRAGHRDTPAKRDGSAHCETQKRSAIQRGRDLGCPSTTMRHPAR